MGTIHERWDPSQAPVEIFMRDSKTWVVATCDIEAKTLQIPPCVPRTPNVYKTSDHPSAVTLTVQTMAIAKKKV